MTVPTVIIELEKVEMTKQTNNVYFLDHGGTKKQKRILQAFNVDVSSRYVLSEEICGKLYEISAKAKNEKNEKRATSNVNFQNF